MICKKIFGNYFELKRHVNMPHFEKKKRVTETPLASRGFVKTQFEFSFMGAPGNNFFS